MNSSEIILDQRPWGRAFGLLICCAVMLIGVARQIAPAEIVLRAFTAASVATICVRGLVLVLRLIAENHTDEDEL
ncbi:MAG TPA: hypothetical protein PK992_06990 [Planctomycetaceae bacterium]|nr:hypothetical protein [Planctomycetaceae bacterium]HRA87794.1 hypothetical protein [Planctomycetaceae bacterium]